MSTSFSTSSRFLYTSESVTEGHPDKICDQVSDAVLDELLRQDPMSRVACETAATAGLLFVTGEITTDGYADIAQVARDVIREIGYDRGFLGFDYRTCGVLTLIKSQSPDIKGGVDVSLEERRAAGAARDTDELGAGDQGMMIGFACRETDDLMPLPISLAHALARRLSAVRKQGLLPYLRPDGKTQVTVEYSLGQAVRVATLVVSSQHAEEVGQEQIAADIREHVVGPIVPERYLDRDTRLFVNPSGRFVHGGPEADAGLTGRKIIVDTYGGMASHGGGAFSGKDATKVDRSGAYAARWVAKNVVAAGIADRFQLQLAYAIGVAEPVSVSVDTFDTHRIDPERIGGLIEEHFDLRPAAIIRELGLRRPIFRQTAAYGHFGRPDLDLPWERTDRAEALRRAAGL